MAGRATNQVKADAARERGLGIKEAARQEARDDAAEAGRLETEEKNVRVSMIQLHNLGV